jgi:hypothetical protein
MIEPTREGGYVERGVYADKVEIIAVSCNYADVVFHAKKRPCNKCQRTFVTFASPSIQADASAYKRAKFLQTHN